VGKHTALLAGGIATVAVTFASLPAAHADTADEYYFKQLAVESMSIYAPTDPPQWRITDWALAKTTGQWLCNRVPVVGYSQAGTDLVTRSRTTPWGFVWSSPDQRHELVAAEGIELCAVEAYCPQTFKD
jgi:hypothetical protein